MAPKRKKKPPPRFQCDAAIEVDRFQAHTDDVFRYNWWEVFCFPYIICARFWECLVTLCAGTNQCLVYWMMIQWLVCKITRFTTPNAIIFPYYFYMFCQVIMMTITFAMIWYWFGRTIIIPYFQTIVDTFADESTTETKRAINRSVAQFRRYCFRKSEIFDNPYNNRALDTGPFVYMLNVVILLIDNFVFDYVF